MRDRVQEAKEEGIRQGIWLCIQRLVHMEQYDMAKYFIKLFVLDYFCRINSCYSQNTE